MIDWKLDIIQIRNCLHLYILDAHFLFSTFRLHLLSSNVNIMVLFLILDKITQNQ